jgi:AcrR family transcriptional regulator
MARDRRRRTSGTGPKRRRRDSPAAALTNPPGMAEEPAGRRGAGGAPSRRAKAGVRASDPGVRRQAILEAALTVFAEHGYEAARLDEVARRAGVAKGTLYLYFEDKEALFENLIRSAIDPIYERLQEVTAVPDLPLAQVLDVLFSVFQTEVLGTTRKLLLRLVIAEGPRFPAIAEFHYRNVVARILPLVRKVAERAAERGELPNDALVRFPQLIAAPLLLAVLWDAMFAKIDPLDVRGFLRAYGEMLTARARGVAS